MRVSIRGRIYSSRLHVVRYFAARTLLAFSGLVRMGLLKIWPVLTFNCLSYPLHLSGLSLEQNMRPPRGRSPLEHQEAWGSGASDALCGR